MCLSFIDFPQTDGGIVAQLHSWGRQPWGSNDCDATDRDPGKAQWKLIRIPSKCAPVEVSTCHPQIQRCDSVLSLEHPILQQLWTSCAVIIIIMILMLMIIASVVFIVIYLRKRTCYWLIWLFSLFYRVLSCHVHCTFQLSHCLHLMFLSWEDWRDEILGTKMSRSRKIAGIYGMGLSENRVYSQL